jgi:hypothetical protein
MENYNVAKVMGKENVELNFTSEKKLLLVNVLHVPDTKKIVSLQIFFVKRVLRLF